jgi:hypothetical protein
LAELEAWCHEGELAARMTRISHEIAMANEAFWCPSRGLYADDLEHTRFSQHANVLATLSGLLEPERKRKVEASHIDPATQDLTQAGIYFSHYVFAAAGAAGRREWLESQLGPWFRLEAQGFKTTPESWSDSRSECHAWGGHPLLHFAYQGQHDGHG